jgi:8-oxo-dGTP pyrophosphatase MutT (NUDIX family)
MDEEMNTYLVGQYRFTLNEYSWEMPEGGCPIGEETVLETAKRELLEETGLVAEEWNEIAKLHLSNSVSDEVAYIFIARKLSQQIANPEDTEDLKVWKLPFEEAFEMVMQSKITDAFTVSAFLKVKLLLDRAEI